MARSSSPASRSLAAIAAILLLIALWAGLVATFAQVAGRWPILVQGVYYLIMGIVWIIPLKPLVRWVQTGSFRSSANRRR